MLRSQKRKIVMSKLKPDRMKFILLCVGMKRFRINVNNFVRKKLEVMDEVSGVKI